MVAVIRRVLCITVFALCVQPAPAQAQNRATLRVVLANAGLADAVTAAGAPDLDRTLTSSEFAAERGSFVAAYYFNDEAPNQVLGPLHVSRFDRGTRQWISARPFDPEISGSVLQVAIGARYVILSLHGTPSAGQGVVLDARTLSFLGAFKGIDGHELQDGVIAYSGSVIHFAPTHQYRLFVFDPALKRSTEVFPGSRESRIAIEYRRKLRTAYARLPQASREEFEQSVYGAVDDFDRHVESVVGGANGRVIAFAAHYSSTRLDDFAPMQTVVRCRRQAAVWTCEESSIEQAARATRINVSREDDGRYGREGVERLLGALVNR